MQASRPAGGSPWCIYVCATRNTVRVMSPQQHQTSPPIWCRPTPQRAARLAATSQRCVSFTTGQPAAPAHYNAAHRQTEDLLGTRRADAVTHTQNSWCLPKIGLRKVFF